jgi:signal transduction histidine kinase
LAVRARLALPEQFQYEAGLPRRVGAPQRPAGSAAVGGFLHALVKASVADYPRAAPPSQSLWASLRALESPQGMLIDYTLRPPPVWAVRLERLARQPPEALRREVLGRVVLLGAEPGGFPLRPATGESPDDPVVARALATVLAGTGAAELNVELLGSSLVLLSVLLMLVMGDRGLRGKLLAAVIALLAIIGTSLATLAWWRLFIPQVPLGLAVLSALLISVCLELAEAGSLVAQEARSEDGGRPWAGERRGASPEAAAEECLRSIVTWHDLPTAALLLRDAARRVRLLLMGRDGSAVWTDVPSLAALGEEALSARAMVIGDWPGVTARAVAVPVILDPGRTAAVLLAVPELPARAEVVAFSVRMVRRLLSGRTARPDITLTLPGSDTRPDKLPLPAQVARLRASRLERRQQSAFAEAWRSGPHEAVVVFDTAGRPVLWNRRAEVLFDGHDGGDLSDGHLSDLLGRACETDLGVIREAAVNVLLTGTPYILDLEDPRGRCNYVASLTRIGSDEGGLSGLSLRCIDVTGICRPARVEARLMSVAAHEMRTPLTSVLGYAELLQNSSADDSRLRRYADAIHRQAGRLEAIVGELLTVTRLEAGREALHLEAADLASIARQVVAAAQPLADAKGTTLSTEVAGPAVLRGDVPKLERVLENLVANAVKYSPQGASVSVRVLSDQERVTVEVQDTGYGVAAQDVPHVFEKFYRARGKSTEGVEGTGLGLAIVRLIVHAHGGSVSLASEEGVGSTFTVVLPVAGPSDREAADTAA